MRLSLARAWRTGLPRVVLLLQAGNAFSWFGYGLILPFEIIYLHQFRGFSTATAGLVLGAILGAGTLATPPSGALIDRFHAKPILIAGNRMFLILTAANLVLIIVGYALFANILPPFAKAHTRVGPGGIGLLFLFNTFVVVVAQLPATRLLRRMRRAHVFGLASAIFASALLAVLPATLIHSKLGATVLVCGVAVVIAIGECVHTLVLGPLVADLAPPHLLGRYISVFSLMVTGGFALGPAIGGAVLATSPDAVWWGGALVAAVIGTGLLLAGDHIPDQSSAATVSNAPGDPVPEPA